MPRSLTPLTRSNADLPALSSPALPRPTAPALTNAPLDYAYDGSFEGLLTVLFAIYDR
jgi:hypothetical protein